MKKFLIKTIIGGLLIIALIFCFDIALLFLPNAFTAKSHYVDSHLDEIKILCIGHSHAENGFVPDDIGDSVFNFSIGGRSLYYDSKIAEQYIPRMKNLKTVIYPIAYNFQYISYDHNCLVDNETSRNAISLIPTFQCMYYKYMGISYNRLSFLYWSEVLNSKLNFWSRFVGGDSEQPMMIEKYKGYFPLPDKRTGWENVQLPYEVDYTSDELNDAYKENIECVNILAKICAEHGVKFVMVSFPCYRTFLAKTTTKGLNDLDNYVGLVTSKYSNASYHNYISDKRFDENDFFNASHLTDKGAHKFSKMLKDEVLKKSR